MEIVLDTETTGLSPEEGHRIVEIGCVELSDHMPTGRTLHQYINPERAIPEEAFAVHGLSHEFLSSYPVFHEVAEELLTFIGEAPLVIHNAEFDLGFINAELELCSYDPIPMSRAIDTIHIARTKFPGARVSLDNLCQRFGIDNSNRGLHGALLDARLLSDVYLELVGGRQHDLALRSDLDWSITKTSDTKDRVFREARTSNLTSEEDEAHKTFISQIKNNLWKL